MIGRKEEVLAFHRHFMFFFSETTRLCYEMVWCGSTARFKLCGVIINAPLLNRPAT